MTSHVSTADKRLADFALLNEIIYITNQLAEAQNQLGLKSGPKKERIVSLAKSTASIDSKRDPPNVKLPWNCSKSTTSILIKAGNQ